jgi:MurNAc alpha-1-phosphate uridylyltransferase
VSLAGLVLAAGRGERLRPLTDRTPKPLLQVGATTLLDAALDRVGAVLPVRSSHVAVNAHWLADQIAAHVGGRAFVSVERPEALGTAGAVGQLRDWLDGRDALITNGDVWYGDTLDVQAFVSRWDGVRARLLVVEDVARPDFDDRWRFAGLSLLPWEVARTLEPVPSGLYEVVWSRMPIDLVPTDVTYVDCGTPEDLDQARSLAGSADRA